MKLEKCIGLECLDIKAGDSLKRLRVVNCPEMASISVYAPNLKSFLYHGALPCIRLQNSPSLVDAVLDMRDGPGHNEFDCEEILPLLAALKDVEILNPSGWLLEVFTMIVSFISPYSCGKGHKLIFFVYLHAS